MDLEGIMPSEIKDKCCMLPLVQSGKKKKKNIRKQKQIHRYNKLVVKWGEEWEEGQDRDRRLRGTSYYADILYSIGNIANIL